MNGLDRDSSAIPQHTNYLPSDPYRRNFPSPDLAEYKAHLNK